MQHQADDEFVQNIMDNTLRYAELFAEAVDELLPPPNTDITHRLDILDVLKVRINVLFHH